MAEFFQTSIGYTILTFAQAFALLVPLLVGVVGVINSLRMRRLPDPSPNASIEGMALG